MEAQAPPSLPAVDLSQMPFRIGDSAMADSEALELVRQTFNKFESWRSRSHDYLWQKCDELYCGVFPKRAWEGNALASRSDIGIAVAFDQVESGFAHIGSYLYDDPNWFSVEATSYTDPKQAKDLEAALYYLLESACSPGDLTLVDECRAADKNTLHYGIGYQLCEWGATGPRWMSIDPLDIYVDPDCCGPNIDECRAIQIRRRVTIEDIIKYRNDPRMSVPSDIGLAGLLTKQTNVTADRCKMVREAMRGVNYSPDTAAQMPMQQDNKIELIQHLTPNRVIYTLNREWVLYNGPNQDHFVSLVASPCYIMPNRLIGRSVPEVVRPFQAAVQSLFNVHVDELALSINPTVIQPGNAKPSDSKVAPGATITARDAKDVGFYKPPGVTKDVFQEIAFLLQRVEQMTGISGAMSGIMRPSNANRTAGGVQAQLSAGNMRLKQLVQNIENFRLVRMLEKTVAMARNRFPRDHVIVGAYKSEDGTEYRPLTAEVFHYPVKFRIEASTRMLSAEKLGPLVPFIFQTALQGPVVDAFAAQGKTPDPEEIFDMVSYVTGIKRRFKLFRPMSEDEQKARQQPPPQVQAQMQKAQMDQQTRLQIMDKKSQDTQMGYQKDLQIASMKQQGPSPWEIQAKQQEAQQKAQEGQQKLAVTQALGQIKLQEAAGKLGLEREKMELDRQKAQQDAQQSQVEHQMNLGMTMQNHQMQLRLSREKWLQQQMQAAATPRQPQAQQPGPQQ